VAVDQDVPMHDEPDAAPELVSVPAEPRERVGV
jgi:hypothetical protein